MTEVNSPEFSFVLYGCQELANNARLMAYTNWAAQQGAWNGMDCCVRFENECFCPTDGVLSDYTDPVTDDACWVDPLIPESPEYLGMYISKVTGLHDSAFARTPTDNIGRGVTLGRGRSGSRVFVIEAWLVATSCCGMDYGVEFVRRTLENGGCGVGTCLTGCGDLGNCGLTCMTARVCCPEDVEALDTGIRQWVNVGLVDGVKEVDGESSCRCCLRKVVFTVQAETAESYACDPVVCLDKNADLENTASKCFDWINGCAEFDATPDCTIDPFCPPGPCPLPIAPQRVDNCFCEPAGVSIDCCCASDQANHRDETFRVTIDAGINPNDGNFTAHGLRNARVLFYNGDPKRPCPSDDEAAAALWSTVDACAVLEIPYLKPGARVVIDGRTDKITVECDGRCFPGWNTVFGVNGSSPFPLLASCNGIFICVEWDLFSTQFVDDLPAGAKPSHVKIERFRVYA